MPLHFFASAVSSAVPTEYWASIAAAFVAVSFLKTWSKGTKLLEPPASAAVEGLPFNDLHGRVVLIASGAFTPVGVVTMSALAHRGAQIIALTRNIDEQDTLQLVHLLRDSTSNELIYVEECDTSDLSSINKFVKIWNEGDKKQPEGVRRLDALLFLPPTVNTTARAAEVYESHLLGKFHMINSMLSSLLLMPPDREIRIISTISPFYAAGLSHFDDMTGENKSSRFKASYSALVGAASLRWYALSIELQRRLNLLAEADPRPRTKLPGIDPIQATTTPMPSSQTLLQHQHARTSNIVLLNICPGFERNTDILDTFLPRPNPPVVPQATPPPSASMPAQKKKKGKTAKMTILEEKISQSTQVTPPFLAMLWYNIKLCIWFALTLFVWPFVWLLSKSPATAANSIVWITIKKLETQKQFLARLQRDKLPVSKDKLKLDDKVLRWDDPLLPTELYREGRIVRPRLPPRFEASTAKSDESEYSKLWTHEEQVVEKRIKEMGGHIVRPK